MSCTIILTALRLLRLRLLRLLYYYYYYYYYYRFTAIIQDSQHTLRVQNWRILFEQSLTARMPLLTTTSAFGLRRTC